MHKFYLVTLWIIHKRSVKSRLPAILTMGVIWREETILWGESVTQAKSYARRFKILISSINYKGKILFLCMYISHMENNEISEKIEMDLWNF